MKSTALLLVISLFASANALAANILYLGDSQSASKGSLLDQLRPSILEQNKIVAGDAVCGARIDDHLNGGSAHCKYPGIQHMLVSGGQPSFQEGGGHVSPLSTLMSDSSDTVVVELGDNHYDDRTLAAKATKMVTQILSSGKDCVWIGPASIKGVIVKDRTHSQAQAQHQARACQARLKQKKQVSDILSETLANVQVKGKTCRFINSFELTKDHPPRSADPLCIHYPGHYPEWASAIKPALMEALNAPPAAATDAGADENAPDGGVDTELISEPRSGNSVK